VRLEVTDILLRVVSKNGHGQDKGWVTCLLIGRPLLLRQGLVEQARLGGALETVGTVVRLARGEALDSLC
jgi:hypothetical protein